MAAVPSYRAPELFADPHVIDHHMVSVVPGYDQDWPLIRMGGRLSATPLVLERAGPEMGEHTHEILEGLLGLSAAEISRLEGAGALDLTGRATTSPPRARLRRGDDDFAAATTTGRRW